MKNPSKQKQSGWWLWLILLMPVIWLAVLLAGCWHEGMDLFSYTDALGAALASPFSLRFTDRTVAFVLAAVLLYGFGIALYYSNTANTRPREEHGSAAWGSPKQLSGIYVNHKEPENNIIFTQNTRMGMDMYRHQRNLNVLVVGGSGSGKTRFFAKPNIMQANCSYLITDPKGENLRSLAPLLQAKGYDIKVFNLVNMEQSDGYNPFVYLREEQDALKLVNNLIRNTTPKTAKSEDPFWEKAETALVSALVIYLMLEAPTYEQNFSTVMYMIENAAASENDEDHRSPVDMVFEALEEDKPDHIAVKQ